MRVCMHTDTPSTESSITAHHLPSKCTPGYNGCLPSQKALNLPTVDDSAQKGQRVIDWMCICAMVSVFLMECGTISNLRHDRPFTDLSFRHWHVLASNFFPIQTKSAENNGELSLLFLNYSFVTFLEPMGFGRGNIPGQVQKPQTQIIQLFNNKKLTCSFIII